MRPTIRGVIVALLLGGLVGCSEASGDAGYSQPRQPHQQGSAQESTAVSSPAVGHVGKEDYESAVRELEGCLAQSNVTLLNGGWDPVNQQRMLLSYRQPGMPPEKLGEIAESCRAAHLDRIEAEYIEDTTPLMAADLMAYVQRCLVGKRINVTGAERSPSDLLKSVPPGKTNELVACVNEGATKLYPHIPVVIFP